MSDPEPNTAETPGDPPADKPAARRISKVRPKKSTKAHKAGNHTAQKPVMPAYPVFDEPLPVAASEPPEDVVAPVDWPEPEPASAGDAPPQEGPKRKRRRKKGKGGGHANAGPEAVKEPLTAQAPQPKLTHHPRQRPDPEKVAKLALKIYLSEVCEEGVALIGDNDARELSRRSFRLAEIFIEEESRQR